MLYILEGVLGERPLADLRDAGQQIQRDLTGRSCQEVVRSQIHSEGQWSLGWREFPLAGDASGETRQLTQSRGFHVTSCHSGLEVDTGCL